MREIYGEKVFSCGNPFACRNIIDCSLNAKSAYESTSHIVNFLSGLYTIKNDLSPGPLSRNAVWVLVKAAKLSFGILQVSNQIVPIFSLESITSIYLLGQMDPRIDRSQHQLINDGKRKMVSF